MCFICLRLLLLGKHQMVVLQNRSSPCLIDACGVITGMIHRPLLTLVICQQAFWRIILSSGAADRLCVFANRMASEAGPKWLYHSGHVQSRLRLPPSCCTWDNWDHSSRSACGLAVHSDSGSLGRSRACVLQAIDYLTVTKGLLAAGTCCGDGNSKISQDVGHRNVFTLLSKVWSF